MATQGARERESLSLSAFLGTEDIGVHIVHIGFQSRFSQCLDYMRFNEK